ncbi:sigma-54 interaction domain-containing protein [Tuberibacillus sp. Marseille-P3662]|uniref:sigma-54 interaction domain-containing protein n=1 Tax=Tuberibacillus sp. Marseille-P3662 TaxID=1965358 RepID=UPI0020CB3279|nr:sigma 54-interacting transcriptional regulator [Tuberibacillus sp. Marseille-P3662]
MLTFQSIEPFMNKQFFLADSEVVAERQLQQSATVTSSGKILLKSNMLYFDVQFSNDTNQPNYVLCGTASIDDNLENILTHLTERECLVVLDKQQCVTGYISARDLCQHLYTNYQKLNAYIDTILDTTDESCTVIDQDQRVIAWTKGAEQLFSLNRDNIIEKPITEFFSPNRLEILNTIKEGTSVHHQQHKAKENQVVLINSNPVYFNNEIIGAVVSETDITSQIRLNKELYHASERLFKLEKEVTKLTASEDPFQNIRGNSAPLKKTIDKIEKASSTNASILIHGESGVGKELFAKAAHNAREDKKAPFVAVNCGAIPSALFESEIFGYEKGAFSGADQRGKKGKVQLAQGGTLFLDEIGEMPMEMQVKMLRLLQEKKFYPVGGTKEIEVDFRVIAATNNDLQELVEEQKFRADLFYRLNVVSIEVPPLRERPEDIIELTHYFLHEISIKYNRPIHGISQDIMQALLKHHWAGNARELKNVIERLIVFSEDGEIKRDEIPFDFDTPQTPSSSNPIEFNHNDSRPLNDRLLDVEKNIILDELEKVDGNKLQCARNLNITRATLYNRIKKLGIT